MRHLLTLTIALLCCAVSVVAQSGNYGLDPQEDAGFIEEMRAKLDKIRESRPTVALVLAGGGAKGASHVGVLKYLEEIGMPVDIIVGTSMGGLVGGLYANGYDVVHLDSLIRHINWDIALSDKLDPQYMSYSDRKYKETFLLSFPFYHRNDTHKNVSLAADKGEKRPGVLKDNLLGSLPFGYINGYNVSNIFSSVTVGYQNSMDFADLPIPFACVSVDMVSTKVKVWHSGKLNTALRSTMSIPGLFAPVKEGEMLLVDGGMKNNYPTNIARELGVDYVIGVDLSLKGDTPPDIKNLAGLAGQSIEMLSKDAYEHNVPLADITINPDMTGYSTLSFSAENIDSILTRGYRAAQERAEELAALKSKVGSQRLKLQSKPASDLARTSVRLSQIEISGVEEHEGEFLLSKLDVDLRKRYGKKEIEDIVAKLYGTGSFDHVNYELIGNAEPYCLNIDCVKGPIHRFGIGARFDTEEVVALIANISLNAHIIQGSSLDFTGKVSSNPQARLLYRYKARNGSTFNAEMFYKYLYQNQFQMGESSVKGSFHNFRQLIYFSNINWKSVNTKLGIMNDYYFQESLFSETKLPAFVDIKNKKNSYVSLFWNGVVDTFDNGYFPDRGLQLTLDYQWGLWGLYHPVENFHIAKLSLKGVAKPGKVFSIIPSLDARLIFNKEVPVGYANVIGGSITGRYLDQQIAFIGINDAAFMDNLLVMTGINFRFKFLRNNYISTIVSAGASAGTFDDLTMGEGRSFLGAGIEYSYNSIFGPIKANIHWSTLNHRVGAYLGVGFDF